MHPAQEPCRRSPHCLPFFVPSRFPATNFSRCCVRSVLSEKQPTHFKSVLPLWEIPNNVEVLATNQGAPRHSHTLCQGLLLRLHFCPIDGRRHPSVRLQKYICFSGQSSNSRTSTQNKNKVRSISFPILGSSKGSVSVSAQGSYSEKLFTISSFRDLETRFTFLVLATLPGRQAQQLGPERLAPLPCPSSLVTQHDELHQLGDE